MTKGLPCPDCIGIMYIDTIHDRIGNFLTLTCDKCGHSYTRVGIKKIFTKHPQFIPEEKVVFT